MADTGFQSSLTVTQVDNAGGGAWDTLTGDEVDTSDDVRARYDGTILGFSDWLYPHDFGFSIPAGATIDGIELSVERHFTTNSIVDNGVFVYDGTAQDGDDKGAVAWTQDTDTTDTYGGAADDWNTNLTPAEVNGSGFGVQFSVNGTFFGMGIAFVDHVQMKITYTPAPAQPNNRRRRELLLSI
jgi:hypothetical protein